MTGTCLEPITVKISDTTFGLVKDSQIIVMSTAVGGASGEQIIKLDDTPYSVGELLNTLANGLNELNFTWRF